ncbi:hypothetical protein DFH06DRAFT_1158715 [Mycena polygramma]|nr:hypothetical protein DFH06DRAFT_1158715 [Mycena polygramma]
MDVDEEPSTVVASSSPAKPASVPSKSLEQSAVPPHNRIINKASLHAPTPLHPRSSSSLLSAVHSIPRARAAPSSVHLKENPPAHPATKPLGPPNSNAPPPTNRSRASISAFSSAAAPVTQDNPKSILPAASSVYSKENAPDRSATQSQSVPQRNGPPPPTNGTASSSKIPMAAPAVVARRAAHSASASVSDTADGKDQGLNKKQRKKLLRKEKRKMKAGDHLQVEIMTAVDPLPAHQSTAPTAPVVPTVVTREPQPSSSRPEPDIPTTSPAQVRLTPPIPYGFTPISELEAPDGRRKLYSVIGVITKNPLPLLANSGNYSCSLRIVDPTNCDESFRSNGSGTEGFMVNCFTTKYAKWLPSASEGSVMILQNIKTSMHGGNVVGTGFDDKLQWAVYDPMTGQIGHGDLGGVPKSERLDGGHGASFTPFYTGTHADLNYCKALDEWWRGVTEKRLAAMGTIHQIGGDTSYTSIGPPKRKHQLISETKTNTFFDCTVRVIHEHSAGLAHRLFVTDGTPVFGSKPCLLTMCPPSLTNCVLQIEMWDEARKLGPTLVPGELYLLRNVLLRRGRDGLTEAKMKEAKISKIGSDAGANLPNFKALLERLKPSYPDSN